MLRTGQTTREDSVVEGGAIVKGWDILKGGGILAGVEIIMTWTRGASFGWKNCHQRDHCTQQWFIQHSMKHHQCRRCHLWLGQHLRKECTQQTCDLWHAQQYYCLMGFHLWRVKVCHCQTDYWIVYGYGSLSIFRLNSLPLTSMVAMLLVSLLLLSNRLCECPTGGTLSLSKGCSWCSLDSCYCLKEWREYQQRCNGEGVKHTKRSLFSAYISVTPINWTPTSSSVEHDTLSETPPVNFPW